MILLDAYALVALLGGERAEGEVVTLLRTGDCGITSLNLAEAIDALDRVHGIDLASSRAVVEPLGLEVLGLDERLAWRAAALRARHYRRRSREVSLADCVLVGAARSGDRIATADAAVVDVARQEGVAVHVLPGTRNGHA